MSEAARIGTMTPPKTACLLSFFSLLNTLDKLINKLPIILIFSSPAKYQSPEVFHQSVPPLTEVAASRNGEANLIGELVDLERDSADGAVGALDLGVLLALDVPALKAGGVLGQHQLRLVLHAAGVQVLRVAPRPALVGQLLVRRLQPRPRREKLLQLPCTHESYGSRSWLAQCRTCS